MQCVSRSCWYNWRGSWVGVGAGFDNHRGRSPRQTTQLQTPSRVHKSTDSRREKRRASSPVRRSAPNKRRGVMNRRAPFCLPYCRDQTIGVVSHQAAVTKPFANALLVATLHPGGHNLRGQPTLAAHLRVAMGSGQMNAGAGGLGVCERNAGMREPNSRNGFGAVRQ